MTIYSIKALHNAELMLHFFKKKKKKPMKKKRRPNFTSFNCSLNTNTSQQGPSAIKNLHLPIASLLTVQMSAFNSISNIYKIFI